MMKRIEAPMNRRILLIDDNEDIHREFQKVLVPEEDSGRSDLLAAQILGTERASGERAVYSVESAFQGEEGFGKVERAREDGDPFAVGIVDMRMPPGWDGLETITRIFSADPEIQVVLCTAFSDHDLNEIQESVGVTDRLLILKKPVEEVELRQVVSALSEKWNLAAARKRAEEHLGTLAAQTRMILAASAEGVFCVDAEGRITFVNPAALQLLADTEERVLGRDLHSVLHPEGFCSAPCALEGTGGSMESWRSRDQRFSSNREGDRLMECAYTPVIRSDSILVGAVLSIRDVTDEREQEAKLLQQQKLESIGSLASGIAHEINTPAQYVSDSLQFLDEAMTGLVRIAEGGLRIAAASSAGEATDDLANGVLETSESIDFRFVAENAPDSLKLARDGIRRISEIVRAVNEYSHPGHAELKPVDLNRIVETAVAVSSGQWKHVACIEMDLDSNLEAVPGHAGELSQVFVNLLVNGYQAIETAMGLDPSRDGKITIRTRHRGDGVEVVIEDNGCGLPEALRDRIFEPFFTTKEVGKGTGQGLAIARSIITRNHNGSIDCVSVDGKGTRFSIVIPRDPSDGI